jgi:hypothetical protein
MPLVFVLFVFFILHIQGLVRFLVFGTDETTYYGMTAHYLYSRQVAAESLLFSFACASAFAIGYILLHRGKDHTHDNLDVEVDLKPYRLELRLLYATGMLQILTNLVLVVISRLDYVEIVSIKYNYSFPFQSRVVFLVLVAHLLLNIPLKQLWRRRNLRLARWLIATYLLLTILLQFRSEIFEIAFIVAFAWLMWAGDRIKVKYVLVMVSSLLVPNLIVLGRLGFPSDPAQLVQGLFSFEYSTIFNNILSEAISRGKEVGGGLTFLPQLALIIPSPVRALFGINALEPDYFSSLTSAAGVLGGGFSFLGEMYSNFGWFGPLVVGMLGMLIGRVIAQAGRVGRVSMLYAVAPLLYVDFILVFRNDFAVFLKSAIQLFIVAILIDFARRLRLICTKWKVEGELDQISTVRIAE